MRDVVVLVVEIGIEPEFVAVDQGQWNIRRLHKSQPDLNSIEPVAETVNRMAFVKWHPRPAIGHERQQHHGAMQYPVVLDMTQQHRRGTVLDFGKPYPHPRSP